MRLEKVKQMQPMWLCLFSCIQFEETYENAHQRKSHTNATNVTTLLLIQAISRHIWKPKLEKSKTMATNVCSDPAISRHIRKPTVEKGQTQATNVTMLLFGKAIWGHIWKKHGWNYTTFSHTAVEVEVVRAMPERKHFFLMEVFPYVASERGVFPPNPGPQIRIDPI